MNLKKCKLIEVPQICDAKGNIGVLEGILLPFEVKRAYYLHKVPKGESRGGHAHKSLQQIIIAISGEFDVELDDGAEKKLFRLNCVEQALYVSNFIWRELNNFSSDAICLVLASERYDESDYFRNYDDFLIATKVKFS